MKVGLAGLGVMGRTHLRVLEAFEWVDQVLVFDPAVYEDIGSRKSTRMISLDNLLDSDPSYLVIASPTTSHLEIAIKAARAAVPCLIEKPIAVNLSEAMQIEEAFRGAGVLATVGHAERFNASITALRDKINDGVLGEIFHVSTERVGPNPIRIRDVGVVLDLATHDLDLVHWVLGEDYVDLHATLTTEPGKKHEGLFVANGRLSSGASVSHSVNWLTPLKRREFAVLGERGMLVADTLRAELKFYSRGTEETLWTAMEHITGSIVGEEIKFALRFDEPLKLQHEAVRDELQGTRETSVCRVADSIRVMKIIDEFVY